MSRSPTRSSPSTQRRHRRRRPPCGGRAPAGRARADGAPDRGDARHRAGGAQACRCVARPARRRHAARCRSALGSRTSSPRRSRCCGRRMRSAPAVPGSSTGSAGPRGSSSRASGTLCPTSARTSQRLHEQRQALRFGTWIGGDLDGNPHVGPETSKTRSSARGRSPRALPPGAARARRGVGDVDDGDRQGPGARDGDEPFRAVSVAIWSGSRMTPTRTERRSSPISMRSIPRCGTSG